MLKCLVCGQEKDYINNTHLKTHGLTIAQYKERYNAEIYTEEFLQRRRKGCRRRVFHRSCPRCGSAFTTGNPKTFYCSRCQPIVSIEKRRRYQRIYRRIRKRTLGRENPKILGTFSPRHLSIHNGRVLLALMLEQGISPNSFRAHNEEYYSKRNRYVQCEDCGEDLVINLIDHQPHCVECGNKIVVAFENGHYSTIEPVCERCGLVYVVPQIPFFSILG